MIRERTNVWQAVVRRKGWPPQRRSFRTRADAQAWARQIEAEMDGGSFVRGDIANTTTLAQIIQWYAAEVVPGHKGRDAELPRCNALQRAEISSRVIASLQRKDFAEYARQRLKERALATVKRELQVFHAAIEWGKSEHDVFVPSNPARGLALKKIFEALFPGEGTDNARDRRISTEEETLLLQACAPRERQRSKDGSGKFDESGTEAWWLQPCVVMRWKRPCGAANS